jgi:hypothetical protein
MFIEPSSIAVAGGGICLLMGEDKIYRKKFKSKTGVIGFRGSINMETGFINRIEIIENPPKIRKNQFNIHKENNEDSLN